MITGQMFFRKSTAVASNGKHIVMFVGLIGLSQEELDVMDFDDARYTITDSAHFELDSFTIPLTHIKPFYVHLNSKETGTQMCTKYLNRYGYDSLGGHALGSLLHLKIWRV